MLTWFLSNIGIITFFFQTLELWPYLFSNPGILMSYLPNVGILTLFLSNIGIVTFFFQTLELSPFSSKHWKCHLILLNIGIVTLFFQRLEFWPYFFHTIPIRSGTHGHVKTSSYELLSALWVKKQFTFFFIGIVTSSSKHWNFDLNPSKHWNSYVGLFFSNTGILTLFVPNVGILTLILSNVGILTLFLLNTESLTLLLPMIGILLSSIAMLSHFSKHQNSKCFFFLFIFFYFFIYFLFFLFFILTNNKLNTS